jgi:hypothetical protein
MLADTLRGEFWKNEAAQLPEREHAVPREREEHGAVAATRRILSSRLTTRSHSWLRTRRRKPGRCVHGIRMRWGVKTRSAITLPRTRAARVEIIPVWRRVLRRHTMKENRHLTAW